MRSETGKGLTWGHSLADWEERLLVGRGRETDEFRAFLRGANDLGGARMLNVTGAAGMGKTRLLAAWRTIAEAEGACWLRADAGERATAEDWLPALLRALDAALPQDGEACLPAERRSEGSDSLMERAIEKLVKLCGEQPNGETVLLAIDSYEAGGALDRWLREKMFSRLPMRLLVAAASRQPIRLFAREPGWSRLLKTLALSGLSAEDVRRYAGRLELGEELGERLWLASRGHPLTMALAAESALRHGEAGSSVAGAADLLEQAVRGWLAELPNEEAREGLLHAALMRSFQRESLSATMGRPLGWEAFDRLTGSWATERASCGWTVQPQLKEALRALYKRTAPLQYEEARGRAAAYALEALRDRGSAGATGRSGEAMSDLLYYAEHPILRAHYRAVESSAYRWVPLEDRLLPLADAYLARRREGAAPQSVACADPASASLFRYSLSSEESVLRLADIGAEELRDERAVRKLLLTETGEAAGLAVIWPISPATEDLLRRNPYAASYMASKTPGALDALYRGKSAFIRTIDVADLSDEGLRHASFRLLLDCLYVYETLAASPPPLTFYADSHRSVGFEAVDGAGHPAYGSRHGMADVYELRLAGEHFARYASRMIGLPAERVASSPAAALAVASGSFALPAPQEPLTEREREVALLLAEGRTLADIAGTVFVSVVTVKKHVGAIYRKYGVANRAQFMGVLLQRT
ncbi:helix-turn-helix transcriptional regulator [Paenibacillus methanolicus]|uniref:Regulatory LuxR family protein n=1 Tax=Paenibacillus methanolicus TaxID=582686 RepID=A0A5S5CAR1_9BACL|nr:LuxR family transcriptional regulator [Paenibacillus methanolicus]TYP75592.1 regulatory LuxR family protein [Paenibacillus methanolicus]